MTIGVAELQKNISIIRNLKETLYVIDKKTNEVLATILPNKKKHQTSLTEELAGSMANGIVIDDLDKAISDAYADIVSVSVKATIPTPVVVLNKVFLCVISTPLWGNLLSHL